MEVGKHVHINFRFSIPFRVRTQHRTDRQTSKTRNDSYIITNEFVTKYVNSHV